MKMMKCLLGMVLFGALGAFGGIYHEVDFDTVAQTLNDVKPSDAKIRFGGNTPIYAVNTNEWAGKVGDPATTTARVNIVDDGTGTNSIFHLNGVAVKSVGGALVLGPEKFGGTSSVARVSFDLIEFNRKAGDGSDGYLVLYEASGYDLSGVTDAKIILQMVKAVSTGVSVTGVNGSAVATKVAELAFSESDVDTTLDVSFEYDGTSAVIAVWESRNKTEFKFDNVVFSDDGELPVEADSAVVLFGGLASVFDSGTETNNAFVSQIGAGEIVQFNGVDSDGGSFGASGTLVNQGVGATLTNSVNDLILTTTAISSSNAARTNTVSSGGQLGVNVSGGAANFQQSDATAWAFEFSKQVDLKQVIFSGLDAAAKDRMRVTVDGVDYDLSPADTDETDAWSGNATTEVYTFPTSVTVTVGTDIIISTHDGQSTVDPVNNKWGLYGVVVDVPSLIETLPLINFGGNPDLKTNETYMAELGGDAIVAWWGGDDDGRFLGDVGTLKDQGVGATLTSVKYGVAIESLVLDSSLPEGTNTFVSGGSLGILGGDNAKLDSANGEAWTMEFDTDVYLSKIGFKGFTGGAEVADIIIGGVTNSIIPADCVTAASESGLNIYTFENALFIAAGTDIEFNAAGGQWGIGNVVIGVMAEAATPESLFADWLDSYQPALGSATNLTDNPDNDALNNLYEYAQGGDPTTPDAGNKSVYATAEVGGTNYFDYVYFRRIDADARGLFYEVELDDNLVFAPGWTNVGYEVINGTVSGDFQSVTNRIPTDGKDQQFINLNIELQ